MSTDPNSTFSALPVEPLPAESLAAESLPAETPAPEVKRPELPRPDNRQHGPQGRGQGKVNGSQRGSAGGKQFAFRKH